MKPSLFLGRGKARLLMGGGGGRGGGGFQSPSSLTPFTPSHFYDPGIISPSMTFTSPDTRSRDLSWPQKTVRSRR